MDLTSILERNDRLAIQLVQAHRLAAEALAGITPTEDALREILAVTTEPCPAQLSVLRGKDVLLARIAELETSDARPS